MAESGRGPRPPKTGATTPEAFPTISPPLPSGDYSYTVELVGTIHHELGRLTEAVNSLKEHAKERDRKLEDLAKEIREVSKDVHSAKVAGKTLLWVVGIIWTVSAVVLGAYLRAEFGKIAAAESHQQTIAAPPSPK
jgi:hypothetical protein